MEKIKIHSNSRKMFADLYTPVQMLMNLRSKFPKVFLLESSEYNKKENSRSFLCFESLLSFSASQGNIKIKHQKGETTRENLSKLTVLDRLSDTFNLIEFEGSAECEKYNGFFGYSSFDAVQYFEQIEFDEEKDEKLIPDLVYEYFQFVVVINHFNDTLTIIEHLPEGAESKMDEVQNLISNRHSNSARFKMIGQEYCPIPPEQFKHMVTKGKHHCQRGDVFQVVFSRRYYQDFKGDDLNVYRALRSINPSPYLFYFDFGSYRIFGSSPETHLTINDGIAEIHPIAGTFRRTGDDEKDAELAEKLLKDEKENAEHVMLVDLARNDLNRKADNVRVDKYKNTQFFSHVIHLTSIVKGDMTVNEDALRIYADSFPAGTLSGAPKYRAMELINENEPHSRSFYGGAIGFLGLNGDINTAIMIRSFLSKNNKLIFQAGCGIVIDSDEEKELQEVENKLAALKRALILAESI
ncbi:anthranilate synthase component I family protein [Portibacter marinus]|uniref:anthranilate synthase component I family protein n=1 Tax=Portibacter marinus TaxID=2898660 RepID=UPI001F430BF3|nr:anthranilate synthase component I family protein [Portibacter marinus]